MKLPAALCPPISIIAHRGASGILPENTRAAFDAALRQGADAIELDLQLSRDGVPVVFHDRTLARAGGGRRRVAGLDLAELRRLDAGSRRPGGWRQRILTLDEVLARYGSETRLLLEIKTREGRTGAARHRQLVRATIGQVRRRGLARRTALLCFDWALLEEARRLAPSLPRALNLRPPRRLRPDLGARLDSLAALSVDVRTLTPSFGAAVRRRGIALFVFTCNTPRSVDAALAAGATGIMADRPDRLIERLRQRNR